MNWDKIKFHLTWVTIAPLVILGYGQLASLVYFIDWVEFAQDIVTEENLIAFQQLTVKVAYLLEEVDRLGGLHN